MEEALNNVILERLVADDDIDTVAANLVEAACQGPEALARVVGSGSARLLVKPQPPEHTPAPPTVGAYLTKLKVAGFRGIGTTATLDVSPGPGLTLVVGRNGSGKSSFAEAFEVLVTGKCARWRGRPVWEDGWRNLHHSSGQTNIEATFVTEGALPMTVARSWKVGGSLAEVEVTARGSERPPADFDALPWQEASGAFRPFLSHSELSSLLDEPSRLYDQLKSILGLEELTAAVRNLSEQKKQLRDHKKEVAEGLAALKQTLQTCADPRAATCLGAVAGKRWKLDAIEQIVLGAAAADETQLAVLRAVAQLAGPDMDEVVRVADRLRVAVQEERQLSATAASRSDALVALLEQAIQYQASHGGDCPVCEGPLANSWAYNARRRAAEAGEGAEKLRAVRSTVAVEHASLKQLVVPVPKELRQAIELGIGEAALAAWTAWANIPALPEAASDHIDAHLLSLIESVRTLNEVATARIRSMDDSWRPVALQVGAWLTRARRVERNQILLEGVERAEEWLSKAEAAMRDERFAPIATQAQAIWKTLRQQSNVDLASVKLEGKATRRHVTLNVTVDGADSIAVSVMSQGELNALALSLFLPRMTLGESPFRFVVVDDPVQAMDPQKVDGLAQVLEAVAKSRQVIVFTHDMRLFDAVKRLQIPAKILEVSRRPGSVVDVSIMLDPIDRYLEDAFAVACEEDKVGPTVAQRIVATFCRGALDAACMSSYSRRRLGRGDSHESVATRLADARGAELYALAVLDDAGRGGEVMKTLKSRFGLKGVAVYQGCKEGAHGAFEGTLKDLIDGTRILARGIEKTS